MNQLSDLRELERRYAQLRLEELLTRATGTRVAQRLAGEPSLSTRRTPRR
ncbi:MAG: hypothetical protein U1E43_08380 [Rhodospirillales bacterium]